MSEDLEKSLGTIALGGSILFFGVVFGILLNIINQILLGRFLGVEKYGLFYLAYTIIILFLPFSALGLSGSLPRFLPYYYGRGEKNIVKSAIRFSELLVLCLSLLIGIIIYFFSEYISVEIFHNINLTNVLKYFAVGLPLFSLSDLLGGIIQAFKGAKYKVGIFDIGILFVRILIFVPFILIGYSLFGAIIGLLIAMIFTIFSSLYIVKKKFFVNQSKYQIVPVAKNLLIFSWPITVSYIILLCSSKTDIILLGYFYNSIDIGIYMVSFLIAQYVTMFTTPFSYMFLPVISELFAKRKLDIIETLFKSVSKWIILMVVPVYIFLLLFPKEIIVLFFGADYSNGYLSLIILVTGISIGVFTGFTGNMLIGGGYTKLFLTQEIIGAITIISVGIVLIPMYGIIGAAISVSSSYFTKNIASFLFIYKKTKMHAYNKNYIGIIISGLVIFIIGFILKMQIFSWFTSLIGTILIGVIIFIIYLVLIWFSKCLDKNDIFIIKLMIKRIRVSIKIDKE
jgi:O-antigen/teichoic acid export membrane protein